MSTPMRLISGAEAEDALLRRAGFRLRRLRLSGNAGAQLARDRRIVSPALVEIGERELDLFPLRMPLGLQHGEVVAKRTRETHQMIDGRLQVVVVGDEECADRNGGEVVLQQVRVA